MSATAHFVGNEHVKTMQRHLSLTGPIDALEPINRADINFRSQWASIFIPELCLKG